MTTDEFFLNQYHPTIHSMPNPPPKPDVKSNVDSSQLTIPNGPWVVTLENFISDEECDRLIELGSLLGYEISMDVGTQKFDGFFERYANERRTSTNAWCREECFEDPLTQTVLQRIENLTGIPDSNSEYLQLLRYEPGQFYKTHHDYIPYQRDQLTGPRILTVCTLYLCGRAL
jgi:prolyl 4-hydroxylase